MTLGMARGVLLRTPKDGLSPASAVESGYYLAQNFPNNSSGYYWIQTPGMRSAGTAPLEFYVDMVEEGGGYDFRATTTGPSFNYVNQNNYGKSLHNEPFGTDVDAVYFRSQYHWRAASNFIYYVRGETGSNHDRYFQTCYMVYKTTGGGNYTNRAFYNGSGVPHRVPDGGRWWLRNNTYSEPNGDYNAYGLFGANAWSNFPDPYNLQNIVFNDGGAYSTGNYYLVSTNAKP